MTKDKSYKERDDIACVKIGELFDLEGEPACIELFERINLGTGEKYYIAKLELIGREFIFSKEEVAEKKLKFVPLEVMR